MSRSTHPRSRAMAVPATVWFWPRSLPISVLAMLAIALIGVSAGAAENAPELTADASASDTPYAEEGPATAYYRWIDGSGRIQYTDFEPVGVPAEYIPLNPQADDAPVLSSATHDQSSDPFHDQDQQILPIEHIGPCADARRQLSILHTALPVYAGESGAYRSAWRGDTYKGERVYLDAEARTRAIATVRNRVLEHCSDPDAFAREEAAFKAEISATETGSEGAGKGQMDGN